MLVFSFFIALLSATATLAQSKSESKFIIRQSQTQGQNYPPADVKGPTPKDSWVQTYNAAKASGKIPGISPSTLDPVTGNPVYPAGTDLTQVCSWTLNHCFGPNDIAAPKDGIFGVSFDDGPQLASPPLYSFLKSQNQTATHFMIGSRILGNPAIFQQAVSNGDQIAVHTWSHPMMTNMTDLQVVGELGWTLQIIYDQSNLIPTFWRPPYGDVDNRVRAIAYYVFGMYTTIWNRDTFDWCFRDGAPYSCSTQGPITDGGLDAEYQSYVNSPKSPGIITLSHELSSHSVNGFIRNYPAFKTNGWKTKAIGDIWGTDWYHNSASTLSARTANVLIGSGTYGQSASVNSSSIPASNLQSPLSNSTTTLTSSASASALPSNVVTTNATSSAFITAISTIPTSTPSAASQKKASNSSTKFSSYVGSILFTIISGVFVLIL